MNVADLKYLPVLKGKTNPDFTGAREEKEKLEKIINDSTARDYNYFL